MPDRNTSFYGLRLANNILREHENMLEESDRAQDYEGKRAAYNRWAERVRGLCELTVDQYWNMYMQIMREKIMYSIPVMQVDKNFMRTKDE